MNKLTPEKLDAALVELECGGMLAAYAAKAAADVLVHNWKAAIRDGHANHAALLDDIDDTIAELRKFKDWARY